MSLEVAATEPQLFEGIEATRVQPPGTTRKRRRGRFSMWLALGWITLVTLAAIFADLLPLEPYARILKDLPARTPPRLSWDEPFGTDALGRSVTSRLVYGGRQTLIVGISAVLLTLAMGTLIGMIAGYRRGKADGAISVILDSILAIPNIVLLLTVAAVGVRSVKTMVVGLAIVGIPTCARLARAQTLLLVNREYVLAARTMGAGTTRILVRELLPHVLLPLSSFAFLLLGSVMVAEGSLSFLGLGIPPPSPSWGGMVNDGRPQLGTEPYLVFVPALMLVLTVLAFTVVGDRVRRRFDARESALL